VADSDPRKEYEETLNKARGLLEAIRSLLWNAFAKYSQV
jgi:anthranilate synthase component 1